MSAPLEYTSSVGQRFSVRVRHESTAQIVTGLFGEWQLGGTGRSAAVPGLVFYDDDAGGDPVPRDEVAAKFDPPLTFKGIRRNILVFYDGEFTRLEKVAEVSAGT